MCVCVCVRGELVVRGRTQRGPSRALRRRVTPAARRLDAPSSSEGAKSLAVQANHLPFSNYKSIGNGEVSVSLDFTSTIIINHQQQRAMQISYPTAL